MKIKKPQFKLRSVYADGSESEPEIYPVEEVPWETKMGRRGFLGVGLGFAALTALVSTGCEKPEEVLCGPWTSGEKGSEEPEIIRHKFYEAIKAHKSTVGVIACSPDGKHLLSVDNLKIKLWSRATGKLLRSRDFGAGLPTGGGFSPFADEIAISSSDGQIRLFGYPSLKFIRHFQPHSRAVHQFFFESPNSLISCGEDGKIVRTEWEKDSFIKTLVTREEGITAMDLSPGKKHLLFATVSGYAEVIEMSTQKMLSRSLTQVGDSRVINARFLGDPRSYIVVAGSGRIERWKWFPETFSDKLRSMVTHPFLGAIELGSGINAVALTPDKNQAVILLKNTQVSVRSLPDGKEITRYAGNAGSFVSLDLCLGGKEFYLGNRNGKVLAADLEEKKFGGFFYDPKENKAKGRTYKVLDKSTGKLHSYTLPCGSPIPPGAICTCNCVPGAIRSMSPPRKKKRTRYRSSPTYRTICTCDLVYR